MAKPALKLVAQNQQPGSNHGNARALIEISEIGHGFHYWEGLTGERYLHSVYTLQNCPELPKANYIIVRKSESGDCEPLSIGQTNEDACSLNLAHIRMTAARLGGNEIHIHVMTNSAAERQTVEEDLLRGQFQRIEQRLRAQAANSAS